MKERTLTYDGKVVGSMVNAGGKALVADPNGVYVGTYRNGVFRGRSGIELTISPEEVLYRMQNG